jgi:hypothetical protein
MLADARHPRVRSTIYDASLVPDITWKPSPHVDDHLLGLLSIHPNAPRGPESSEVIVEFRWKKSCALNDSVNLELQTPTKLDYNETRLCARGYATGIPAGKYINLPHTRLICQGMPSGIVPRTYGPGPAQFEAESSKPSLAGEGGSRNARSIFSNSVQTHAGIPCGKHMVLSIILVRVLAPITISDLASSP